MAAQDCMNEKMKHFDTYPTAPIAIMGCSVLLFLLAALSINANTIVQLEQEILSTLAESSHPGLDVFFNWATLLGDFNVICPIIIFSAAVLLYKHQFKIAGVLCISFFGAALTTTLLKMTFDRPRPDLFDSALSYLPGNAAFPSGHTTHATALALFLVWLAFQRPRQRYLLFLVAGAMVILVAISRLYLQIHWPTDLIGGLAVSLFWLSLAVLITDRLFIRRTQNI